MVVITLFESEYVGMQILFMCAGIVVLWSFARSIYSRLFGFKRVGSPSFLSWLPGSRNMRWSIDKHAQKGYSEINKALDQPFIMRWWAQDFIFLPSKYLIDLKRADNYNLSFFQTLSDAFSLHSSVGDLYSTDIMVDVVKRCLNPQLPSIIPLLAEECEHALTVEIKDDKEWKQYNAGQLCGRIMHRVTSRVLMGEELCRNIEYIESSMKFAESIFVNAITMTIFPFGPFRRLVTWIGSIAHRRNLQKAMNLVVPVVEKRIRERQGRKKKTRLDAIEWTIEMSESMPKENNPTRITHQLLHNIWAGSAAPGGLVTQMLFQILMEPDYLAPLREESEKAISNHGWSEKALNSMLLLDSFIRETNRLHPAGSITGARTVMGRPYEFQGGLTLPVGSRIAFPALAIQQDPDAFQDPLKFDGFRFARMDTSDGKDDESERKWGAATVGPTNLAFGYGKHACAGRFYAVRKAKLIFSRLILDYDFKWAKPISSRPQSFCIEGQFAPNLEQTILLKKRRVCI